jgi:hypothetical protein
MGELMPTEATAEQTIQHALSLVTTARESIDAEWTFAPGEQATTADYGFLQDLRKVLIGCTVRLERQLKTVRETGSQSPEDTSALAAIASYTATLSDLLQVLPSLKRGLPPKGTALAFRDGAAAVHATAHIINSTLRGIVDGSVPGAPEWKGAGQTEAPYHETRLRGGRGTVILEMLGVADDRSLDPLPPAAPVFDELMETVMQMNELTADTFLVILAQVHQAGDPSAKFTMTADMVLDSRNIQRKRYLSERKRWDHGHRSENRIAVGRAVMQLASVWLTVNVNAARRGVKTGRRLTFRQVPLIQISERQIQTDLDGRNVFMAGEVNLGKWASESWNAGIHETALLSRRLLEADLRDRQPERRIGRHLVFAFRQNWKNGATVDRHVSTLLDEAAWQIDQRNPGRERNRFEKALNWLRDNGVIGDWHYNIKVGKNRVLLTDPDTLDLPARGWVKNWCETTVSFTAPADVQAHYASIPSPHRPSSTHGPRRRLKTKDG